MSDHARRYLEEGDLKIDCEIALEAMARKVTERGEIPKGNGAFKRLLNEIKGGLNVRKTLDIHDVQIYCRVYYKLDVSGYLSGLLGVREEDVRLRTFRCSME